MKRLTVLFLMFCLAGFALAQNPEGGAPPPEPRAGGPGGPGGPHGEMQMKMRHPGGDDPLAGLMFPPEMILRHAEALNLTPEQKTAIRNEVKASQAKFTDLQFQLQDNMEALHKLLKADKTDEKAAMVALDEVLNTERDIKRMHVGMIVRIKNLLTKEQVDKLHQMHEQMPMKRRGPEGGGPGPGGPDEE